MHIDLRLLRSFVAIHECGSMSRAATRVHCSQAAMSMRLKILEDQVGHRLFLRHHHRLEPTALACELYAKALAVLASYDELVSTTRSRDDIQKVRIGVPDDYALSYIARVFADNALQIDGLELDIVCDLSSNLVAAVQRQDIDFALVTVVFPPPNSILISQANLLWIHHPSWNPYTAAAVPLAVYPEGCVFRKAMIAALEDAHKPWRIVTQSRSQAGVLAAVHGGVAITVMADGTVPVDLATINSGEILPTLNQIPIYLVKRPGDLPKAITALERGIIAGVSRSAKAA